MQDFRRKKEEFLILKDSLSTKSTAAEIEYYLTDSEAQMILCSPQYFDMCQSIARNVRSRPYVVKVVHDDFNLTKADNFTQPTGQSGRDAMIVYTSGTTGNPKGVVHTHSSLHAQYQTLSEAWQWSKSDRILNVLPLHHVHGINNVLNTALWNGAECEMVKGKFDPQTVWLKLLRQSDPFTLFMAVPTVYGILTRHLLKGNLDQQYSREEVRRILQGYRLMVSGSAALPEPQMRQWEDISGQVLLERFGMTEILMALSNPYTPIQGRKPGRVGQALPGVQAAILDLDTEKDILPQDTKKQGELLIRSSSMFDRYLGRPEATASSFFEDNQGQKWFRTGDCVTINDQGSYRIEGRLSQDIIKKGGYKISALEIEAVILSHPEVKEVCVYGIPDEKYGEEIVALVVFEGAVASESKLLSGLEEYSASKLSGYKVPRVWKVITEIPRNQMGKVNKKSIRKDIKL